MTGLYVVTVLLGLLHAGGRGVDCVQRAGAALAETISGAEERLGGHDQ